MNNIPIFDSLTHPTLNNDWILPRYPQVSNIDKLLKDMEQYNITKALAVGMKSIGNYSDKKYIDFILSKTDRLIPIAFFDVNKFNNTDDIKKHLNYLKRLGYIGIKLHTRIGNFELTHKLLPYIINYANKFSMTTLLCTYFYNSINESHINNTSNLIALLEKTQKSKIILLHGGNVKLLEFMEITRAYKNILLDLSLTLVKYKGSSIDLDISFLFKYFDQRICIGSDHPEISIKDLRLRFNEFSKNISYEKASNIAHKNLSSFFTYKNNKN